jgi:hypothetical protein
MDREPAIGWTEALGEHATNPATNGAAANHIFALGQDWPVSALEARIMAAFEKWCRREVRRAIRETEQEDPEEGAAMRSEYMRQLAARVYTWQINQDIGGAEIQKMIRTEAGFFRLLFLLMERCNKDFTEDKLKEILIECAERSIDPATGKANPLRNEALAAFRWSLGNAKAPAKKTTGANGRPQTEEIDVMTLDSR